MKPEHQKREMSSQEIERAFEVRGRCARSGYFDRFDLSVPQQKPEQDSGRDKIVSLQRRMRGMAVAAAATPCLVTAGAALGITSTRTARSIP